jgi:glycosyltransferase involved in cell wall biosynthesis
MLVSVCMMVKDGGKLFETALASIKGFADELVLVNTAAEEVTQDTRNAFKLPADIRLKLIHSPWQDDFSLHRNESIEAASGDWIMILDSDEEITFAHGFKSMRAWLRGLDPGIDGVSCLLHDMRSGASVMQMSQPRIFRKGRVRYQGRVHNQIEHLGASKPKWVHGNLMELRHYGYDPDQVDMQAKRERRVRLLNRQLEEGDFHAYFWLMQDAGLHDEEDKALKYAEKYRAHEKDLPGKKMNPNAFFPIARRYLLTGRLDKAASWLEAGLKALPHDLDLAAAKSDYGAAMGDFELMARGAVDYVQAYKTMQQQGPGHGRFCYTNKKELYAYYLCRACLYRLRVGLLMHNELEGLLRDIPERVKEHVSGELSDNFAHWAGEGLRLPHALSAA